MSAPIGNQGIYKITSPTGRVYIGQSVDIPVRFSKYRGMHCHGQRRLYASLMKHGVDCHSFEIIELVEDYSEMIDRERYWQEFYGATGQNGLNCKLVEKNCHAGKHSSETKLRMSESAKRRKHTEESKKKMSKARLGKKMPEEQRLKMIGRKASDDTKEKHKARMTGNQYTKGRTPVNAKRVVCLDTGIVFEKVSDAARHLGMKESTLGAKLRGDNRNDTAMRYA